MTLLDQTSNPTFAQKPWKALTFSACILTRLEKEIQHLSKELDSQILKNKEQSLLIHTQNTSNNLEFELASLKRQLLESEQTAERRQTDYQDLLKSLLPEQKSSSYWQKECQDLVMKLDYEVILDLCSSTGVMIYKTC